MCFTVPALPQVCQVAARKTEVISKDIQRDREPLFFCASVFWCETCGVILFREYTTTSANMIRHQKCCITHDDMVQLVQQCDFDPMREWIVDLGFISLGDPNEDMLQENIEQDILNFYHSYNPDRIEIFVPTLFQECYLSCLLGPNFLITIFSDSVVELYPEYSPLFTECSCDIHQNGISCSLSESLCLQWAFYRKRWLTNNSN